MIISLNKRELCEFWKKHKVIYNLVFLPVSLLLLLMILYESTKKAVIAFRETFSEMFSELCEAYKSIMFNKGK